MCNRKTHNRQTSTVQYNEKCNLHHLLPRERVIPPSLSVILQWTVYPISELNGTFHLSNYVLNNYQ